MLVYACHKRTRSLTAVLRLMGLPSVARYPEASVTREDERLVIRFGGLEDEQTMSVPLKYVSGDEEAAELGLLAQLQRIGYRARRGP
jgi:hypothetical protein